MQTDVTGILETIDNALTGDTSGDAMRWTPPTVTVTFIWDDDAAIFTGVSEASIEKVQPGQRIWVNDALFEVVTRHEGDGEVTFVLISTETQA